jgi:hypothetical protein
MMRSGRAVEKLLQAGDTAISHPGC